MQIYAYFILIIYTWKAFYATSYMLHMEPTFMKAQNAQFILAYITTATYKNGAFACDE